MTNRQEVISLIQNRRETPTVDFKREFYKKLKHSDFAKDIAAFANTRGQSKYIIFGIDDKTREVVGILPQTFPSADDLDGFLNQVIEPFVNIESGLFEYKKRMVGYIKILDTNSDPPYMIKETCGPNGKTEKGDIYIRKGTCNQKATRMDLDAMYADNGSCSVRIFEDIISLKAADSALCGRVVIEIYNSTSRPLLFCGGAVHLVCGEISLSRKITALQPGRPFAEAPAEILAKTRRIYTALFAFDTSDCVMLGLEKSGKPKPVSAQAILFDTDQTKYISEKIPTVLLAPEN